MTRKAKRIPSEARAIANLNRIAATPPNAPPPTDGIICSAESLGMEIDRLHAGVLVYMDNGARRIADKFHLQTRDVLNAVWEKLRP